MKRRNALRLLRPTGYGLRSTHPTVIPRQCPVSIPSLVRFGGSFGEREMGLRRAQVHTRNAARRRSERHFAIDEFIVEADRRRLLAGVRVIESAQPRPVDGAKAYRPRLATPIELANGQRR